MQHAPTPRGSGQPLARYFGKYFGKYFVLSYKKYFVIRTVSCIRQFRLVGYAFVHRAKIRVAINVLVSYGYGNFEATFSFKNKYTM